MPPLQEVYTNAGRILQGKQLTISGRYGTANIEYLTNFEQLVIYFIVVFSSLHCSAYRKLRSLEWRSSLSQETRAKMPWSPTWRWFSSFIDFFILMIYHIELTLLPFHIFYDYDDGFHLSLRWRQHILMVLMKSKESHGDWLAVGFNSDLSEALNTKYKVQWCFFFERIVNFEIFLFACFCF